MCYNVDMRKIVQLDSGLKVVLVPNPAVRSVAVGVFVGSGVVNESEQTSGISHFIEHMVFKGTSTRSCFDIVNQIDSVGAQINAYTAKSYTCFYTISLDTNVEKCAEILSDMYFEPAFDAEELEKERRVVIEEINEAVDTPDDVCLENLLNAFFKGNPLGKPILGSKKTLEKMTPEVLRDYHRKYFTADNTVVAIAGNITQKSALELVKTYFESKFSTSSFNVRSPKVPLLRAPYNSALTRKKKRIEQAHIAFAFPCYGFGDPRIAATRALTSIFCMEMSSRLFQSVREKLGLCYTISGYPSTYINNGAYTLYTSTSPDNTVKAVKAIRREIDILLRDGVSEEELKKAKEQIKTSFVLGQESTSSLMRTFGTYAILKGELYDFNARIDEIDRVTTQDVADAAKYIFDFDKVCASLVSPNIDDDILKAIKEG